MRYKRIVIWLCIIVLCFSACSTTTLSVTMQNDDRSIHVIVVLSGTTWDDLVWKIDGTTYTAIDTPALGELVVHLQAADGARITVHLPEDSMGNMVFMIPTEDGTEISYTAPATMFQALLDWCGKN